MVTFQSTLAIAWVYLLLANVLFIYKSKKNLEQLKDNNNNEITKKTKERMSSYIKRLSNIRSDKRFVSAGNYNQLRIYSQENNTNEFTVEPRNISNSLITLPISQTRRKALIEYNGYKYTLDKIQLTKTTCFSWNQNNDVDIKKRNKYLHDGEIHLHFSTYNSPINKNVVIVIGMKDRNNENDIELLNEGLQSTTNSFNTSLERMMPRSMGFFSYSLNDKIELFGSYIADRSGNDTDYMNTQSFSVGVNYFLKPKNQ